MSGSNDQRNLWQGSASRTIWRRRICHTVYRGKLGILLLFVGTDSKKFQQQTYGFSKQKITVSIGLAMLRQGWDAEKILQKADEAMYQSKENGKNQITVFEQEKSSKPFEFTELGTYFRGVDKGLSTAIY